VFFAMDGSNMEETQYLRQKAVDFADWVRTGFLSRQDATYALHRTIMKTLEYPMVATTMDKLQWDYIMAPILQANLFLEWATFAIFLEMSSILQKTCVV
jgi:hypothetical protein